MSLFTNSLDRLWGLFEGQLFTSCGSLGPREAIITKQDRMISDHGSGKYVELGERALILETVKEFAWGSEENSENFSIICSRFEV
jgi:hypothetical protein